VGLTDCDLYFKLCFSIDKNTNKYKKELHQATKPFLLNIIQYLLRGRVRIRQYGFNPNFKKTLGILSINAGRYGKCVFKGFMLEG
jgi:hypothetical protein